MKVYGYYHRMDLDGKFSAAVMIKAYPQIELKGFDYGDDDVDLVKGYDLVIVSDISFSYDDFKYLIDNNKEVVWLDHHARVIKEIESTDLNMKGIRDTTQRYSACVLTWKYLFPDEIVPEVLNLVEDYDLWQFKYSDTKFIYNSLSLKQYNNPENLVQFLDIFVYNHNYQQLYDVGCGIEEYIRTLTERALKNVEIARFDGHTVGLVNARNNRSLIGNLVLQENPEVQMAVVYCINSIDSCAVSLRSRGDVDTSLTAKKFDGGGHAPASGFNCDLETLTDIIQELYKYNYNI